MTSATDFNPCDTCTNIRAVRWSVAGALILTMLSSFGLVTAQTSTVAAPVARLESSGSVFSSTAPASGAQQARAGKSLTEPLWADLTAAQKVAVRPLYADWASLPAPQKRKWIEVTKGFAQLSPADQAKYHLRMSAWSALSAQQRAQARLNFADVTGQMTPDERKSKWQAYQALSPEEKQRLRVAGKGEQTKSIALAPRPVAPDRLAVVPKPNRLAASAAAGDGHGGKTSAKIALTAKTHGVPRANREAAQARPASSAVSGGVESFTPVQTPVTPP